MAIVTTYCLSPLLDKDGDLYVLTSTLCAGALRRETLRLAMVDYH